MKSVLIVTKQVRQYKTMGIIQRQGIKNSLVNYLGLIIGAISTLFIYTLDLKLYGSIQIWMAGAALLVPFLTLGSHSLVQKYYPYFKNNNYRGFLKMILILTSIIIVFSSIILYFTIDYILEFEILSPSQNDAFRNALDIIFPLSILSIFIGIFRAQAGNYNRIVIPDLIEKLGFKILVPLLILAYVWNKVSYPQIKLIIIGFFLLITLIAIGYVYSLKAMDTKGNDAIKHALPIKKNMFKYMIFNVLNQIGTQLTSHTDKLMLAGIMATTATGRYTIFLFLAGILEVPTRAIHQISSPIISKSFEINDLKHINLIYRQTSLNLTIFGVLIFGLIWFNIEYVFQIMSNGEEMRPLKYLFLLLGLAKIMDMLTSVNTYIILYSKFYKYNIVFILIMAATNIVLNYIFISKFGIIGAGIGTTISIIIYNILKSSFIWYKFKIQPFSRNHTIPIIVLMAILLLPNYSLNFNPLIAIIITSTFFGAMYIFIIFYFNVSPEIKTSVLKLLKTLKKRI